MEMTGETLREIAVLVGVFFMLDNQMEGAGFSVNTTIFVLLGCVGTLALGMLLEIYSD